LTSAFLLLSGIVEPFRLLIILLFKTNLERFDATHIEDYNTLQDDTIADPPRYAVSHHSDVYSGTTLVTASRCTAIDSGGAAVRAVDHYTDDCVLLIPCLSF